jgi:DNA-binding transcriptional regulator YdaS (Cro superfamily)
MSRISALASLATGAPGSTPPFDVEKSENRPTTPDVEWPKWRQTQRCARLHVRCQTHDTEPQSPSSPSRRICDSPQA